ncbi:MAG TPA: motility-associated protein, partial [Acidobacteriota bacterium]|nr:motility-associated protein [Acidobacteriota bacterium]
MSDSADKPKKTIIDIATFGGIALAAVAILGGNILEGGSTKSLIQFTAGLIVVGGTFAACMVQFPMSVVMSSFKSVRGVFIGQQNDNKSVIKELIRLANKARKNGVISLEEDAEK